MGYRSLLLSALGLLATCTAVQAQAPDYNLGKTPTPEQIKAWNLTIDNDGKGLPPGSGTAAVGAKIYADKCALCHGVNGWGGEAPVLIMNKDPKAKNPRHVFPSEMPFAPVVWDYIHRSMPMLIAPGTLKPDEVYSLVAFLFYKNDMIKENDVMDAQALMNFKMPKRDEFVPPVLKSSKK